MKIYKMETGIEAPTLHEVPVDLGTFRRGIDYDGDDETPETITLSLDELPEEVNKMSRKKGPPITGGKYHDDDPILEEEYPDETPLHVVFERENPATLTAAEKADTVTAINRALDRLHNLQTDLELILMSVDRGG